MGGETMCQLGQLGASRRWAVRAQQEPDHKSTSIIKIATSTVTNNPVTVAFASRSRVNISYRTSAAVATPLVDEANGLEGLECRVA